MREKLNILEHFGMGYIQLTDASVMHISRKNSIFLKITIHWTTPQETPPPTLRSNCVSKFWDIQKENHVVSSQLLGKKTLWFQISSWVTLILVIIFCVNFFHNMIRWNLWKIWNPLWIISTPKEFLEAGVFHIICTYLKGD